MSLLSRRGPRYGGLAALVAVAALAVFAVVRPSDDPPSSSSTTTTPTSSPVAPTSTTSVSQALGGRPVLAVGARPAATALTASADCRRGDVGRPVATLSWTPASPRGSEQRVAVTIYRDGFERGDFRVGQALAADQATFEWERIEGQALHHWRVLTLHPDGWQPSETATFEGPVCPSDGG